MAEPHNPYVPTKFEELPPTGRSANATPLGEDTSSFSPTDSLSSSDGGPDATGPYPPPLSDRLPLEFGDYELLAELGRGGMGVVYKARQRSLGRFVALKMLVERRSVCTEGRQRLGLEARAAAAFDHPNIVPVYEVGEHDGCDFFTMAYVEGETLADRVPRGGLPIAEAVRILQLVAAAMDHVHRAGLIHRDLKPSNILIDRDGRPRVSDFGLAKQFGVDGGLTATGQVLGTPSYMAPEQAMSGGKGVGPVSDVYALGGVLYYALTGMAPVTGSSYAEILLKVVQEPPTGIREVRPAVPAELEAVCMKCLAKSPAQRFPSAAAFAQALGALTTPANGLDDAVVSPEPAGDPTSVLPTSIIVPTRPPERRSSVVAWVGGGVMIVLLLVAGALLVSPYLHRASGPAASADEFSADWDILGEPGRQSRHDFDLKVQLSGGTAEGGEYHFENGQFISFVIETKRDAYIGVWDVRPDGTTKLLFPNRFDKDNHFLAGQPRDIPTQNKYRLRVDPNKGARRLYVLASTTPWDPTEGENEGPAVAFRNGIVRDIVIVPAQGASVSETLLPYRVRR